MVAESMLADTYHFDLAMVGMMMMMMMMMMVVVVVVVMMILVVAISFALDVCG